jgi:anti-sigma regulatory factor (Ser/Thr protein kinase)
MPEHAGLKLERYPAPPGDGAERALTLRMSSDVGLVDAAVDLVAAECFTARPPSRQTVFRLRVTLAEALANAILCGNGGDPAKGVFVEARLYPDAIRLAVRDEGHGFDPEGVRDPRDPDLLESPVGRGLFIIRHLADEVRFSEKGNTIWMMLPRW